jgi:2-isopropylmalate synthase
MATSESKRRAGREACVEQGAVEQRIEGTEGTERTEGAVERALMGRGRAGSRPGVMPHGRYRPAEPVALGGRTWPSRRIERAPRWCSVDLRDGNQALVEPMEWNRKIRLFETLVAIGFTEIEVGFPSASQTELDFVRRLIEEDRIPEWVTIQVLTPCRDELIDRTIDALAGARRAIVHFYNSTSPVQRRVVFGQDREGIRDIAVRAAERVRRRAERLGAEMIRFEYSPESFSATEVDFSVEICEAVMDVLEPTAAEPVILNLPATVESATPNVYADQVELFARSLSRRKRALLSVHPHNDRGTAVAAAELALLAGADRVEGTLFGNGERTGNVDLVTLALNLMSQGVDPELDLRDLPTLVRRVEYANRLPVHPRHPYAGELVYTAFSGSHQDAIRKGLAALQGSESAHWEVPYLPIDPVDVGGTYEAVIRINSQSGKGGVAHVLETEAGYALPRRMQIEFSQMVQAQAETSGLEITGEQVRTLFEREYLTLEDAPKRVGGMQLETSADGSRDTLRAELVWGGVRFPLRGEGAGPIDAFLAALRDGLGLDLKVGDYHEHALGAGAGARAVAYVELVLAPGRRLFGAGVAVSIVEASFAAVLCAVGRAAQRGWLTRPSAAPPRLAGQG